MKQENVAKHGVWVRGWRAAGSDEGASQMHYVGQSKSSRKCGIALKW